MSVLIRDVSKRYADTIAVAGCSLQIEPGELLALVGPSGCGKSTLLNVIAGFVTPDAGQIEICGRKVNELPVRERGIAYVMAGLGLYPHLDVFANVAYPLRVRSIAEGEIRRRVLAICGLTGLDGLESRKPSELSSGQQQRVAVARALVRDDASVLLADECFSSLDAQSRFQLRGEFRSWQRSRGLTCVFVTHDQEEALSLGDRVALMNKGQIDQVGTAADVYQMPRTLFVASFLGRPAMNQIPMINTQGKTSPMSSLYSPRVFSDIRMEDIVIGIRPEDLEILSPDLPGVEALVEWVEPFNPDTLVHLRVGSDRVIARVRGVSQIISGTKVKLGAEKSRWHRFDRRTGARLFGESE